MKKKIKDLTPNEIQKICINSKHCGKKCPLHFDMFNACFYVIYKDTRVKKILNKEIDL